MNKLTLFLILILLAINFIFYTNINKLHKKDNNEQKFTKKIIGLQDSIKFLKKEISMRDSLFSEKELSKVILGILHNCEKTELRDYLIEYFDAENVVLNLIKEKRFFPDAIPLSGKYALSQKYSTKHKAIDLAAPIGEDVKAVAAGVIIKLEFDKYLGNIIEIDHLNGFESRYAHLEEIKVKSKMFVEKNEVIGSVGNTGNSTDPHLHLEIIKNNVREDPEKYLIGLN